MGIMQPVPNGFRLIAFQYDSCIKGTLSSSIYRNKSPISTSEIGLLAPPGGLEPLAYRLGGDRSVQLSYGGKMDQK